jgi:hypothetical protein
VLPQFRSGCALPNKWQYHWPSATRSQALQRDEQDQIEEEIAGQGRGRQADPALGDDPNDPASKRGGCPAPIDGRSVAQPAPEAQAHAFGRLTGPPSEVLAAQDEGEQYYGGDEDAGRRGSPGESGATSVASRHEQRDGDDRHRQLGEDVPRAGDRDRQRGA